MLENQKCLVCGDPKAARHYGSVCCSGCKGFFRRSIRGNPQYFCCFDGKCEVKQVFRNSCKSCRLKKCLEVKMHPMLVHDNRKLYKRRRKKEQANVQSDDACLSPPSPPSTVDTKLSPSTSAPESIPVCAIIIQRESNRRDKLRYSEAWLDLAIKANKQLWIPNYLALGTAKIIPQFNVSDPQSITNYYVLVEKLIDNFYETGKCHIMDSTESSLDLSIEEAFDSPKKMSLRTKMDWSGKSLLESSGLNRIFCRLFLHYIDWASHFPELSEMSNQDCNQLMFSRSVPCIWIMLCLRSINNKTKGISLSAGMYFPSDEAEQGLIDKAALPFLKKVCGLLMEEFIQPAVAMNLTECEYALLRVLCFFTAEAKLSQQGKDIVRKSRNFYLNVLVCHLRFENPLNEAMVATRVSELLSLLPILEIANRLANDEFCFMTLFNVANMQGKLTYDLYVRKSL